MGKGKRVVFLAAVLSIAPTIFAQEATSAPAPAAPAAPPQKPLMWALDQMGIGKPLEDANINIYGYVEGSYEYNFNTPPGPTYPKAARHFNAGRVFDTQSDNLFLNQADLTFERTVDYTKDKWDVGARVEFIYGQDARFIHANGLDFYGPNDAADGGEQVFPENQFDLAQAYVDIAVPVGTGLRLRVGKFYTLLGYESINPTSNPLFSHSYLFGYAIPFTQTGILGTYNFTDSLTVNAGITRGWEQALKDNNGDAIDFLGNVAWTVNKQLTVTLGNSTGPERAGDVNDYRSVWDLVVNYAANDTWTFGYNADLGYEQGGANAAISTVPHDHAWWYGMAGYAGYKINDYFTVNTRLEWFNDQDNSRGLGTNVYEGTLGVTCTPFPSSDIGQNLKIRPEIRYDYAQAPIFSAGTNNNQCTVAIEAYFTY